MALRYVFSSQHLRRERIQETLVAPSKVGRPKVVKRKVNLQRSLCLDFVYTGR